MSWFEEQLQNVVTELDEAFGTDVIDKFHKVNNIVGPIVAGIYGGPWAAWGVSAVQGRKQMIIAKARGTYTSDMSKRHRSNVRKGAVAAAVFGLGRQLAGSDVTRADTSTISGADTAGTAAAGGAGGEVGGEAAAGAQAGGDAGAGAPEATADGFTPSDVPNVEPSGGESSGGLLKAAGEAWDGLGDYGKYATIQVGGQLLASAFAPDQPTSAEEYRDILAEKRRANRFGGQVGGGGRVARIQPYPSRTSVLTPQQMLSAVPGFRSPTNPNSPAEGLLDPTNIRDIAGYGG